MGQFVFALYQTVFQLNHRHILRIICGRHSQTSTQDVTNGRVECPGDPKKKTDPLPTVLLFVFFYLLDKLAKGLEVITRQIGKGLSV